MNDKLVCITRCMSKFLFLYGAGVMSIAICTATDTDTIVTPVNPEDKNINTQSNALLQEIPGIQKTIVPIPGMPAPMDLRLAGSIRLSSIDVTVGLNQNMAQLVYTCLIDIPEDIDDEAKTLPIGIPFLYNDRMDNLKSDYPLRAIPFKNALLQYNVGVDSIICKSSLVEATHPQADAPSMFSIREYTHWLKADIPNKPGRHVVTFQMTLPYEQSINIAQGEFSGLNLGFQLKPLMSWFGGVEKASLNVFASEMRNKIVKLDERLPKESINLTEKGVYTINLLGTDKRVVLDELNIEPVKGYKLSADKKTIEIDGKQWSLSDNYNIQASSSQSMDDYGNPVSADNLKVENNYWVSGSINGGEGEKLLITLPEPKQFYGLMLETGMNPIALPKSDTEAHRYPDINYMTHNRPASISVTLNGEYTYEAGLDDDWLPQLALPVSYTKPVTTIQIEIKSLYRGTKPGADTWMTRVLPIVK